MLDYYEQRQPEYEKIYAKPERQEGLSWLKQEIESAVVGKKVLEIACGTGYWTRRIADSALSILATDGSEKLAKSAAESCHRDNVKSDVMDAFAIPKSDNFDCLMSGFFFSHILIKQRRDFIKGIANALKPGSTITLFDNCFVEGSNTPISTRTESGDTYQMRSLADGSTYEVLKNFPSTLEMSDLLSEFCQDVVIQESEYFWIATARLRR